MGSTMDEIILNQTLEVVHGVRDLVLCPEVGFDIVEFDDLIGDRYATPLWITDFHYDSVETLVYGLGALIGFAFTMISLCATSRLKKLETFNIKGYFYSPLYSWIAVWSLSSLVVSFSAMIVTRFTTAILFLHTLLELYLMVEYFAFPGNILLQGLFYIFFVANCFGSVCWGDLPLQFAWALVLGSVMDLFFLLSFLIWYCNKDHKLAPAWKFMLWSILLDMVRNGLGRSIAYHIDTLLLRVSGKEVDVLHSLSLLVLKQTNVLAGPNQYHPVVPGNRGDPC